MLKLKAKDQLEYYPQGLGYNCDYEFPFLHTHDYWEFDYVQYDMEHVINGTTAHIYPNSLLIVKPEDEHLTRALPSKYNPNNAPTYLNVKVTQEKLHSLLDPIDPALYGLLEKTAPVTKQINDDTSAHILAGFLASLLWKSDPEAHYSMLKTAICLIVGLCYSEIYHQREMSTPPPSEVSDIIWKINSKKYLNCPISEITSGYNYSYMQLTRMFRKATGMTMQDYFLHVKLKYAAEQLRLTNRLTLDISNDIGISSLSHFNHIFKQRYGVTPGKYRKELNRRD